MHIARRTPSYKKPEYEIPRNPKRLTNLIPKYPMSVKTPQSQNSQSITFYDAIHAQILLQNRKRVVQIILE